MIKYSSVATPAELYFKSVMQKGQTLDVSFLNIKPKTQFSIAYKGLRSEVKYINQLQVLETLDLQQAVKKKNEQYFANVHFDQDIFK
jgi:hypothetical protein